MDLRLAPRFAGFRYFGFWFAALLLFCICRSAAGGVIDVQVSDREGNPVPDVAVFVASVDASTMAAEGGTVAVMDQIDFRFEPHLLVVQKGTSVSFPNTDSIAHHVYSFSDPNQFDLPLYKGDLHPPVTFDHAGIVTLGCNIHDDMLGYILVVDTDAFRKTNDVGRATLPLQGSGEFNVQIWSPRFRDFGASLTQTVRITDDEVQIVRFDLESKLRPPHDADSSALAWSEY